MVFTSSKEQNDYWHEDLWNRLSTASVQNVEEHFSLKAAKDSLTTLFKSFNNPNDVHNLIPDEKAKKHTPDGINTGKETQQAVQEPYIADTNEYNIGRIYPIYPEIQGIKP